MGGKKFTREKLEAAIKAIKKKYGEDSIIRLSEDKNNKFAVERWSTGLPDFDEMLQGGMPKSRIVQFWGPEGVGKTTLSLELAKHVPFCVYIDGEGMLDEDRVVKFGINPKRFMLQRPNFGEEAAEVIIEFTKANVPLIVMDSVPSMVPEKVQSEEIGKSPVALIPRLLSQQLFPRLIPALNNSQTTIVFINQVREKVGVMFGDPYDYPGGRALKHYLALNIQLARKQWFGPKNNRLGMLISARVTKSKICNPFRECELVLSFDKGFVTHNEMKKIMKEAAKTLKERIKNESNEDDE